MEGVNDDRYQQLVSPGSLQPKPIETLPMPDFVEKFSLNTEQTKTFLIVKSHMEHTFAHETNHESNRTKPEQLLMYIGASSR